MPFFVVFIISVIPICAFIFEKVFLSNWYYACTLIVIRFAFPLSKVQAFDKNPHLECSAYYSFSKVSKNLAHFFALLLPSLLLHNFILDVLRRIHSKRVLATIWGTDNVFHKMVNTAKSGLFSFQVFMPKFMIKCNASPIVAVGWSISIVNSIRWEVVLIHHFYILLDSSDTLCM